MSREVTGIEQALEFLKKQKIAWRTVNRIQNSLWDTGVAFFGTNHHRLAYYDETQSLLTIS